MGNNVIKLIVFKVVSRIKCYNCQNETGLFIQYCSEVT